MNTIQTAVTALEAGTISARALVEKCLERIADPSGEGGTAFLRVYADEARAMADGVDKARSVGRAAGPLAGIPISVKDLFDVAGETTAAGSQVLANAPPAKAHAVVVARCLAAGMVPVGRTNMTEFAFSGLGINPHHGTPRSPWDRATGRIPGGSSSGAAVSVADGMALGALGTDTGGSCRTPAAMCGIVGYKPTARRVPITGVLPLAPSLDSVGPLANTVACCAAIDAVLAGRDVARLRAADLSGLRLAVPENIVLDGMDKTVAAGFDRALMTLARSGARIVHGVKFPAFDEVAPANRSGGFAAAEAYAWHRDLLAKGGEKYDRMILARIMRGEHMTAADYIGLLQARRTVIAHADEQTSPFDALIMPTCPLIPPAIAALEADDGEYNRVNLLQLRNTALGNFLDRCAISLPIHVPGEAPVGLMLMGETMGDARLFSIAAGVEAVIRAGIKAA